MDFKNYLGYKVYQNGNVVSPNGITLKKRFKNGYCFYLVNNKKIGISVIVLLAFNIYPPNTRSKINFIDGNNLNNSLENLQWK